MNHHPAPQRRGLLGRPILTVTLALATAVGAGVGGVALADRDTAGNAAAWREPAVAATKPSPSATTSEPADSASEPADTITLSATGDIMMSNAPHALPPDNGDGFFDAVRDDLASDLVMGNLEQPLTQDTGVTKCAPGADNCYAYRSPPGYAQHLVDAGFDLMNTANNHTRDYGVAGARNTRAALKKAGLRATGALDEIAVVEVKGVRVAVVGFAPYSGLNTLNDESHARALIQRAKSQADLVVVQVHMGAEGDTKQHVRPGHEIFYGEDRGDPIRFSHLVIDAGADVVIGHSPHVLRGMEFYRGRLIAYSLGNFAGGGHALAASGVKKYAGILRVTLNRDGGYVGGSFRSTYLDGAGLPARDRANERGRALVRQLTAADFPTTGAHIAADGAITPAK